MKICILITGLGTGGAEKHLLKILPKTKFDKFIISLTEKKEIGKEIEKKGIKTYYLKGNPLSKILQFRKIIKKEKPDILDTYLIHANIFGRVLGRLFGVKKIINSVRNDYSDLKFLNFLDKITQGKVNLYVPNSKALIPYLHNKNKIPLEKIKVVPNCVDASEIKANLNKKYSIKKELGLNRKDKLIVCVARLKKQKDQATLIKAMSHLPQQYKLALLGDGPEEKRLKKLTKELKLSKRVFFLGKRKDTYNVVNSSDIFVLPSLKEGMSNALLEAMYLKTICVVSDIPQNKVLIKDKDNGLTFRMGSEKNLAEKIKKAMKKNKFGSRAKKNIENKYDIDKIVKGYEEVVG